MATSKAYVLQEPSIVWTDAGGDYALDLGGLAADAWRAGTVGDLGSGARADRYELKVVIDGFDTAPVVGEVIVVYLAFSDGTNIDGDLSGTDGLSSAVVEPNIRLALPVVVQTVTAADEIIASRVLDNIVARYVIPVVHNDTADALLSTSDAHKVILTPMPIQGQAT
jgi:hypothetical protein